MTEAVRTKYRYATDQRWFIRMLEIIPGAITWTLLIGPIILSFFLPIYVSYFIIAFDLFWLLKALRMSTYLVRGYRRLRDHQALNWRERLNWLEDPEKHIKAIDRRIQDLLRRYPKVQRRFFWNRSHTKQRRGYVQALSDLSSLKEIESHQTAIMPPSSICHLVIIATYNESRDVLEPTVKSLLEADYPSERMIVVIAYEERGGQAVKETAEDLIASYGKRFNYASAIMHPDNRPGELRGKGANITYAARQATADIIERGIDPEHVVVTTLDADNKPDPQYFAYLTYVYALDPNRVHKSYQPIPMFLNNIWDAPAPMRVIAAGNSFYQIMEMMRPHRLRNFSSHAQPLRALIETDFWSVTSPVEDGHQFWRSYFIFNGDYAVVPLYIPIYQDAVLAETYPKTFKAQYIQLRRWAYGISDFSFVVRNCIRNNKIPLGSKLIQTGRLLEGHISWATAVLLITFVAWLPLFLNPQFSQYGLAHELPVIASHLQSIALIGLFVMASISIISLPPRPERYGHRRSLAMVAQWLLFPITGIVFNALAAIDSQTRLMLGRYLGFNVTVKSRRK
ncbi:MAG TPA: glycosyltransferase family 2 protein [Candidatus Saccharimonadia bacterium]